MRKRNVDAPDPENRRELLKEYRAIMARYRQIMRELERSEAGAGVNWATVLLGILGALTLGGAVWLVLRWL